MLTIFLRLLAGWMWLFTLTACDQASKHAPAELANPAAPAATAPTGLSLRPASRAYITVETVKAQSHSMTVEAPMRLEFRTKALSSVGAVVAGRFGTPQVQVGEKVTAGTALATLSSVEAAQLRADFIHTQAELRRAESLAQRQRVMQQAGVGIELERMEVEAQLQSARADYDRAAEDVRLLGEGHGNTVVLRAPIDGTLLRIGATAGSTVEANATLFELGEPDALWAVAEILSHDAFAVRAGTAVNLDLPGNENDVIGRVATVSATIDPELRRGAVYIEFETRGRRLKPGMFGRATLHLDSSDQIILPTTAVLLKDGGRALVYVETADNQFESREVKVGLAHSGHVSILSGVSDGERVVTAGALLLDAEAAMLL